MKSFNILYATIITAGLVSLFAKPIKSAFVYPSAFAMPRSEPPIYRTYAWAYPSYHSYMMHSLLPEVPTPGSPIIPAVTTAFVKHHQPDHKGDEAEDADDTSVNNNEAKEDIEDIQNNNNADGQKGEHKNILKLVYPLRIMPAFDSPDATQYHAQDAFGQYQYGYSNPLSAKNEIKTADGITQGSYSYIDGHGRVQTVNYISDPVNGFRVAATNLPIAPRPAYIPDAPDVAAAKRELFRLQQEAIDKLKTTAIDEEFPESLEKK